MKPAPFEYHRPDSVDEALALLAEHGYDAKLLAGGQSLVPAMNFRLAQPAVLIDLNRVPGLSGMEEADGSLRIGAMTRQAAAERSPLVAARAPLLAETRPFWRWPALHAVLAVLLVLAGEIAYFHPRLPAKPAPDAQQVEERQDDVGPHQRRLSGHQPGREP